GFLEVGLRSHADGRNPLRLVGYIEGWYVAEDHGTAESARNSLPARRTGHAVTGASRWLPMPSSTMSCRSAHTRPWVTRLSTAVCIIGIDSENPVIWTFVVAFASLQLPNNSNALKCRIAQLRTGAAPTTNAHL